MRKQVIGLVFCCIAALLTCSQYISAAIYTSGGATLSSELFHAGLEYVGYLLPVIAGICVVAGIAYLIWGEIDDHKN